MKLTIEQALSIYNSLSTIKNDNSISIKIVWAIDDILELLKKHVERGEKERQNLLKKYGDEVKDKEGVFEIKDDKKEIFFNELKEIFDYEIEEDIKQISFDDLQKEEIKISKNVDTAILRLIIKNE